MPSSPSDILDRLRDSLIRIPQVKFAYVFGSHARGDVGPLSDIDIAVFLGRSGVKSLMLTFRPCKGM